MYRLKEIVELEEIKKILNEFDKIFIPNLSEVISDLDLYALKLKKKAKMYVIEVKEENIGFLAFYLNRELKETYVTLIAVKNGYQQLRVGSKLLKKCEVESKNNNIIKIKLEVYKNNKKAISFYKNNNFKKENIESEKTYHLVKLLEEE